VLRSWDAAFLDLQRQVDEMFEELIYRPWAIPGRAGWRPPLDLHETPDAYLVEIDLPGVAPEQVRVLVSERDLAVTAQRQAAAPDGVLSQQCERPCGTFQRVVNLPRAVDPQQVRAEYRDGICRIYLPKKRQPPSPQPSPPGVGGQGEGEAALSVEGSHYVIRVAVP
jgi:HSP20 family protein